jgi:hypothetical protein
MRMILWDDYWRDVGVAEDDLGVGEDCIIDLHGGGPRMRVVTSPTSRRGSPPSRAPLPTFVR